jgi:pimeloyl-ACP methyl ester carboxylesterase
VNEVGLLPKGAAAAESWRQEFTALRRQRLADAHPLGDLPLAALERGRETDGTWHAQQIELAGLSTAGKLSTVSDSGHMIHLYRPDAVADAILATVRAARQRQRQR